MEHLGARVPRPEALAEAEEGAQPVVFRAEFGQKRRGERGGIRLGGDDLEARDGGGEQLRLLLEREQRGDGGHRITPGRVAVGPERDRVTW